MRAAPPATVMLASGRAERAWVVLLHAWAGMALGAWLLGVWHGTGLIERPGQMAGAAALGAIILSAVGWPVACRLLPPGRVAELHWSGQSWCLRTLSPDRPAMAEPLSAFRVRIDLGSWLLLSWAAPERGRQWGVLRAACAAGPGDWHALRVALAAHATVQDTESA